MAAMAIPGDDTKAHPQRDHLVRLPGQSAQGHSARHEAAANGDGIFLAPDFPRDPREMKSETFL